MREGWTYKKLGEVCESDLGKTLNSSKDTGEMRPYLCAINILWDKIDFTTLKQTRFEESELERYTVRKGDLLICEGGEIGRAAIWDKDYSIQYQNALHRVRFTDGIAPRFCLYFFMHLKKSGILDGRYGKGVTIKHLVKSSLMSIPIPVAPIENQLSIVAELDKINELISLKKAQLSDLDSLAQSIFYDMFGDPIENEKGWEVKKLGEIAVDKLSYGSGASAINYNGETRYVRITDINDNGELDDNKVSPSTIDEKYLLKDGDILFARSGATVGKTFLYTSKYGRCIYAGYLIRYIPDRNKVIPNYVLGLTKTHYYKSFIESTRRAVAQPNINAKQYGELRIPLPPLSLQQEFAKRIELIEQQKTQISSTIKDLETLLASRMQYWFD